MKLELLNSSQLKIIFEQQDMDEWGIDFESLDYENLKTRTMFWEIMQRAQSLVGFDTQNSKLIIEAIGEKDDFSLFVTKIYNPTDFEKLKKLLDTKETHKFRFGTYIFKFNGFEELLLCIDFLKNCQAVVKSTLYLYKGEYYAKFLMHKLPENEGSMYFACSPIHLYEFGERIFDPHFEWILNEHGEKIIKNNLIETFSKLFLNK